MDITVSPAAIEKIRQADFARGPRVRGIASDVRALLLALNDATREAQEARAVASIIAKLSPTQEFAECVGYGGAARIMANERVFGAFSRIAHDSACPVAQLAKEVE